MRTTHKMDVILERFPYRFVQKGLLEINGEPDYRIQKFNEVTRVYRDMYYLDSSIQLDCAIEDPGVCQVVRSRPRGCSIP